MQIGNINIDNPLFLAPMDEVTDQPFRLICKELGADILYSEFTSSEALIRDIPNALKRINFKEEERPIGIQIFGNNEESMSLATKKIELLKPDFIDINAGCWARKHVNRGECAGLLKDLNKLESIIKSVVTATNIPVTLKTRLGWDKENIVILDVAKIAENNGVKALIVHCRTRNQGYKGQADWTWLSKIKKEISIPLVANGDVVTPEHSKSLFEMGCDGVMIGRGAISNPWIFAQTKHYLKTGNILPEINFNEKINICIKHLKLSCQLRGEQSGVIIFRKHYAGYLKGVPFISELRKKLMELLSLDEVINCLLEFSKNHN